MKAAARAVPGLPGRLAPATPRRQVDFEALLGPAAWARLAPPIRRRFAAHPAGAVITYPGRMQVQASLAGRLLAQLCRLIGTPLAPWTGEDVRVEVSVRLEDGALVWDRLYRFAGRAPVLVSSRKLADGDGVLEMVRGGVGMALSVREADGALHFDSRGYVVVVGPLRLRLPDLFTPGAAHVVHQDLGGGRFRFALTFRHPWLGETFHQDGVFDDAAGQ
jgi:hypothetical protein